MGNFDFEEEEEEDEERRVLPLARTGEVKNRITRIRRRKFLKFILLLVLRLDYCY